MAGGMRSVHDAPLGYTAARSHRMPDRTQHSWVGCGGRASFSICFASTWFGSQYCRTRASDSRLNTNVVGAAQSVGNIGCHTAKTDTRASGCSFKSDSTAEAPRRQRTQVGDSSRMIRVAPSSRLKSAFTFASDAASSVASGS